MTQDTIGKFNKGITESQTSERTTYRSIRRLRERHLLRRERLFRLLHTIGFLPPHFDNAIGWDPNDNKTYGKFIDDSEPKIAWEKQEDGTRRFIFQDSFHEMIEEFKLRHPSLVADDKRIPYDWTIYYLRKKALTQAITKEELAWLILHFNQKRGYNQLRGEEEEQSKTKKEEYHELKVVAVETTEHKRGADTWYNVHLENGWIYRRSSKISLDDWVGKVKKFIVTTEFESDGITPKKDKEGNAKRSFRSPSEDDWTLIKKCTEQNIEQSQLTVGAYIYENLLQNPEIKIKGNLVRTIERKFYRQEFQAILAQQAQYHVEFQDEKYLKVCIDELYPKNVAHQKNLLTKDLAYLILQDLIFYQRPLKSKKSLIANCPYEQRKFVDKETGEIKTQPIKCIAKSNPLFQEFRLWQFVANLRLFSIIDDKDVTEEYLKSAEDYSRLFDYLNDMKEIKQETLLKDFFKLKKEVHNGVKTYALRWNYVQDKDKKYPCNETRSVLLSALSQAGIAASWIDNANNLYRLWHLLYSVENKTEIEQALHRLYNNYEAIPQEYRLSGDEEQFVAAFLKVKPFKKDYGAYSEKAIKKLLCFMRRGKYWSLEQIDSSTRERIEAIVEGNMPEQLGAITHRRNIVLEKASDFQGLPTDIACYIVYQRFSEIGDIQQWKTPQDLQRFLRYDFKQHSLRNPIVEQCVLETLRTVQSLWEEIGRIDEIHVEIGREMKATSDQRKSLTESVLRNENTNLRIRHLLTELKNDFSDSVRPYSPSQQEILKIYEEGALRSIKADDPDYKEIIGISQKAEPTASELKRYKLWLDQKYVSPYTGRTISLSKLFTKAYEIEHIIPKARYFDDSFNNKVICESEVNGEKDQKLAYEFICESKQRVIRTAAHGDVAILDPDSYKQLINMLYPNKTTKKAYLLAEDIPEGFINRQLNDTRYISKTVVSLLSNIVREDNEREATAKNVLVTTGAITDKLKQDWGLNDVWNTLVYNRFERLNEMTQSELYGKWETKDGKRVFQTIVPIAQRRGFSKKRIDHRHHAMDALVVACTTRNIVNFLNNQNAKTERQRQDLKTLLCDRKDHIAKPWETFTEDAHRALENIIVTFKNNVRIINKATNKYKTYDANGKRVTLEQKGETQWTVRKPLHKETIYGHVNLRRKTTLPLAKAVEHSDTICDKALRDHIKGFERNGFNPKQVLAQFKARDYRWNKQDVKKVEVWQFTDESEPMVATRKQLDTSFDAKQIAKITDTGIQKILTAYLEAKNNDPNLAFSPEGIAEMNQNITLYNNGKQHKPILKVRLSEPMGAKFAVGQRGNKKDKYVVAQKGTNLFFAIYENEEGKRSYETPTLREVIERSKQGLPPVSDINEQQVPLKFFLSPNDLVYVPTEEERLSPHVHINPDRVYKMVSNTGFQCFFVKSTVATAIVDKFEYSALNKMERAISGEMIKEICWKIEVDRLGNIINIIR